MWIMGQNEKLIIPLRRFDSLFVRDCKVIGYNSVDVQEIYLGAYDSEERAKEVLCDLFCQIDNTRFMMPDK